MNNLINLKELRREKELTQKDCASYLSIPLRTLQYYEKNPNKINQIKIEYIIEKLNQYNFVDENHGILDVSKIKEKVEQVLKNYDVKYCYLFGSYAKNKANEKSDVDLLISTSINNMDYFALVEDLRESLNKKVDLLTINQLNNNQELLEEILKDGIKIYG